MVGIEFTDTRLTGDEIKARKEATPAHFPFAKVPVLLIDGGKQVLADSKAITRYVCQLGGVYPADPFEAAREESVVEAVMDIVAMTSPVIFMKSETDEQKAAKAAAMAAVAEKIPAQLDRIEGQLSGNYFSGERPGFADVLYFGFLGRMKQYLGEAMLASREATKAFHDRFAALPAIAAYLDGRAKVEAEKAAAAGGAGEKK